MELFSIYILLPLSLFFLFYNLVWDAHQLLSYLDTINTFGQAE